MTRSIIIARSSTDRHDVSCKSQVVEISAEVKKRGEIIAKVLEFPRTKHSDFMEDPDFLEILEEAKQKDRDWNKVWFYDTSRLSRNRMKAQTTKAFFKKQGIEIDFLKLPKTGQEPIDNVIEGILETFDQLHSDFSRAGSIRGQKQNIRSGYRAGGNAPYGYQLKKHVVGMNLDNQQVVKSTLEPHPEQFPIVKEFLTRRAKGEPRGSIIKDFSRRGIRSPNGKPQWMSSTCHSIENNLLVYCGHLVYNRHNSKIDGRYVGGKRYKPESEWEVHKDQHPAAITEDQAKAIRIQNAGRKKRAPAQPRTYLLTGILECGDCGGPMVGDSGFYTCIHKRTKKAKCKNSNIKAEYIDAETLKFVKNEMLSIVHFEKVIDETRRAYEEEVKKTYRDKVRLKSRIRDIDSAITRLLSLFERGTISPETIEQRIADLEAEKFGIESTLTGDEQFRTAIRYAEDELDEEIIKRYADQFEDLLNESNMELMRDFVKTFIEKIVLGEKKSRKRKSREVHIHGQIPAFTRIEVALPRGFEPLLPA